MKLVDTVRGWLETLLVAGEFVDCGALFLVLLHAAAVSATTERPAATRVISDCEANNMGTAPFGFRWGRLFGTQRSAAVTHHSGHPRSVGKTIPPLASASRRKIAQFPWEMGDFVSARDRNAR
ncbi:hypothetical protein PJI13_10845 [Mycobacterium kansasii]